MAVRDELEKGQSFNNKILQKKHLFYFYLKEKIYWIN